MRLNERIAELKARSYPSTGRVLTVYLNTEADNNQQAWSIHLKNGLKRLGEYAESEGEAALPKAYDKLQKKLMKKIDEHRNELKNGVIAIASADEELWFFEIVQAPVPNSFYWTEQPQLDELTEMLEQYPSAGIILVGAEKITVLDTYLGGVEREWNYEWDMESEDWKQMKGIAGSNREASGSTHKDQFAKRVESNLQRWLKRLSPIVERHNERNKWDGTILTGEPNLVSDLASQIRNKNTRILSKNLNGKPSHQVLLDVYSSLRA